MLEREALRRSSVDDVPQEMVLDQPREKPITKLYLSNLDDMVSNEDIHVLALLLFLLFFIYLFIIIINIFVVILLFATSTDTHTETDTSTQLKYLTNDLVSCRTLGHVFR